MRVNAFQKLNGNRYYKDNGGIGIKTEMEANGIESPEMNLQIHGQIIFYNGAKTN